MSKVLEAATVYVKLPYNEWLYLLSTGGKIYEN